jgi:two-component system, chemotaxis family, chemotaxis protein CheY
MLALLPSKMTAAAPTPASPVLSRKSLRVLYADDMQQLRELITIVLGRDGHVVEGLPNGEAALDRITAQPAAYDVVITDHHMPGMNGLELVTAIRQQTAFNGKLIIFSSELSDTVDQAYRRMKVDHILPKPIFPSQIRAVFATL